MRITRKRENKSITWHQPTTRELSATGEWMKTSAMVSRVVQGFGTELSRSVLFWTGHSGIVFQHRINRIENSREKKLNMTRMIETTNINSHLNVNEHLFYKIVGLVLALIEWAINTFTVINKQVNPKLFSWLRNLHSNAPRFPASFVTRLRERQQEPITSAALHDDLFCRRFHLLATLVTSLLWWPTRAKRNLTKIVREELDVLLESVFVWPQTVSASDLITCRFQRSHFLRAEAKVSIWVCLWPNALHPNRYY